MLAYHNYVQYTHSSTYKYSLDSQYDAATKGSVTSIIVTLE